MIAPASTAPARPKFVGDRMSQLPSRSFSAVWQPGADTIRADEGNEGKSAAAIRKPTAFVLSQRDMGADRVGTASSYAVVVTASKSTMAKRTAPTRPRTSARSGQRALPPSAPEAPTGPPAMASRAPGPMAPGTPAPIPRRRTPIVGPAPAPIRMPAPPAIPPCLFDSGRQDRLRQGGRRQREGA